MSKEISVLKLQYKIIILTKEINSLVNVISLARKNCAEDKDFLIKLRLDYKDKFSRRGLLFKKLKNLQTGSDSNASF